MGDFPVKSVIKWGRGKKQSFFQGHRGVGKTVIFPGTMRFWVKRGYNYSYIVVGQLNEDGAATKYSII